MHTEQMPRVLVVEDEPWIRQSVEVALKWSGSGVIHIGSAGTGGDAIARLRAGLDPDVALIDLGLPDVPGTVVIREIRRRRPHCVCIVFTVFEDSQTIVQAIRAGAQGYLLKSSRVESLVEGVKEAAVGGAPMTPSVARLVLDALRDQRVSTEVDDMSVESLTSRERDVLGLLAKGLTYAEVADSLSLKLGTIQGYVKRIYQKLQVDSKAEAATLAQRVGLV